jgi:phytoene dehydrogenase-like protein
MDTVDAVVIGSGPNGLVAANLLVDAGWSVLLLEAQPSIGGAVRSDRDVHPDYVHDTFSSFYPLSAISPVVRSLRLEEHGLQWAHAPAVVGTPFADGAWGLLHPDRERTAAALDGLAPGDGEAWLRTCEVWDRIGDSLVGALLSPMPPVRHGLGALTRLPKVGGLGFVRSVLTPARTFADELFTGQAAKMLVVGNAGHADIPMDAPGSGLFGWLLCMLGQTVGFPVPVGGAGALSSALEARFRSRGGEVRTSTRATQVHVGGGRARAVRTEHGDEVRVRRAVLADVSAPALYGGLVDWADLPVKLRTRMTRFEWDPGTVKVDWALDGPVPWATPPSTAPGTVHVAETVEEVALAGAQVNAGAVPAEPFLLVGQMAAADPTRAPEGHEALWAYTHVPQRTTSDAGEGLPTGEVRGTWDHDDRERFADRMQARLERYAPSLADRVVARRVLGPRELEQRNENLVGGALNGGTASLHQQLVLRPVPGTGRAETPVKGLYLASASAHPGGGVHGACGANAARAALGHARLGRLLGFLPGTART